MLSALMHLAAGEPAAALEALRRAVSRDPHLRLPRAALEYAEHRASGQVYEAPEAFRAFIDGGGNRALYAATTAAARALCGASPPRTLLDVGCGDGRVTAGALGDSEATVTLVEPSAELLASARAAVSGAGAVVTSVCARAEDFVAGLGGTERWDTALATFSLHTLQHASRRGVLRALAERVSQLLVVEFDVPAFADRSEAHARYVIERYERGLDEYSHDPRVIQGFLMPVLFGQFGVAEWGTPRHTWEQPTAAWAAELRDAGFRSISISDVADYWWAPARSLTARR